VVDETETAEQCGSGRQVQVHALHEQGPVAGRERLEVTTVKRALMHAPASSVAQHQARLDIVTAGEADQGRTVEETAEARHRRACEQCMFLPVAGQKCARREARE
jgi:hypothetical protein